MTKTCYTYDPHRENRFLYEYYGYESPLEPGVFLLPENNTWIEPLPPKENYLVVFNKERQEWEYLLDLDQVTFYDTRTGYRVDYPKREEQGYYTELKPEYDYMYWNGTKWVVKLDRLKEILLSDMDFYRYELEKDGFPLREHGIVDMNERTYKALNNVVQDAFNRLEDTIIFRLKDNSFKEIPKEEAFLASLEMWRKLEEINKALWLIKDTVRASKSYKEITSIPFKDTTLLSYMPRYRNTYAEEEVTDGNS